MAFVGRARQLSHVLAVVDDAARGRARLALVSGPAGIGKTTLVGEAVLRTGLPVGWGTCADAERTPALWPWTVALRGARDGARSRRISSRGARPRRRRGACPRAPRAGAGQAQAGGRTSYPARTRRGCGCSTRSPGSWRRLVRQAPAIVVLDDLQWADASSLALLRFLVRPYRPVPLVVIGAYRDDELDDTAAGVLDELAAHGESVELSGTVPGRGVRAGRGHPGRPRRRSAGPTRCTAAPAGIRSWPGSSPSCSPIRRDRQARSRQRCARCVARRTARLSPAAARHGRDGRGGGQRAAARRAR